MRVAVGLVIRPHSVDIVEARKGFGGIRLATANSVPVQGPDDAHMIQAIRSALDTARIAPSTPVAVSVPPQDVLLRSFTMPKIPKSEWATAIQFEARKYVPFKMQELFWNFYAEPQRATKQLRVAFVGIRKETLGRIQSWLDAAGVKAACVEAQTVSLARLNPSDRKALAAADEFTVLVDVDVEGQSAHLVIAKGSVPYFSREVNLHRERDESSAAPAGIDPRAEVLSSELRLSLDFFLREYPQAAINRVVLFGDQLVIGSWSAAFSEYLNCPVLMGALPVSHGDNQQLNLRFACAVGMVLRLVRPMKVRLDFEEMPHRPSLVATVLSGKANLVMLQGFLKPAIPQFIVGLLIVGLAAAAGEQWIFSVRQRIENTIRAFPDVGWGLKEKSLAQLQQIQQIVEVRVALLNNVRTQRVSVTEKLDALARQLPAGVWLEGMSYQNPLGRDGNSQPSLTVSGGCFQPETGKELDTIRQLSDDLKGNPNFFRGFTLSQLAEVGTSQTNRQQQAVSYRTFKFAYQASERRL